MLRNLTTTHTFMDSKATTGVGTAMAVSDYQNIIVTLSSEDSASFTIKFQGAIGMNPPDFSAAKSVDNQWEYIQMKDYQNGASINGSTGVAFAGTDDVRMFEFNTNGLSWVNATITAISAGEVTLIGRAYSTS